MSLSRVLLLCALSLDAVTLVGAVYTVRVARRLRDERIRLSELRARIGEPVAYRRADGHVTVEWPSDDVQHCLVARELLDQIVDELNAARGVS